MMGCWGPGSTDLQKEGVPLHQHQSDAPSYASCGWRTVEDTYARALNTRLLAVSQWASFSVHKAQNERIFINNMFYDDQLDACPQLSPNGTYLLGRQQRFLTGCPAEVSHYLVIIASIGKWDPPQTQRKKCRLNSLPSQGLETLLLMGLPVDGLTLDGLSNKDTLLVGTHGISVWMQQ